MTNSPGEPPSHPILQRVWVISSDRHITEIKLNLPGAVFVDFDADLGVSSDEQQQEEEQQQQRDVDGPIPTQVDNGVVVYVANKSREQTPPASGNADASKDVARVVVTSDSKALLDSLDLEAYDDVNLGKGLRVRVKNEEAELKGSIMTQVFVNEKHAVRSAESSTAACVIGDGVLVHHNSETDMWMTADSSGFLFVSSDDGFSLRSLTAIANTEGVIQLRVPFIDLQEGLHASTIWNGGVIDVSADTISARMAVEAIAMKSGDVVLQTAKMAVESCSTIATFNSSARIIGDGTVKEQTCVAAWSSSASSPGIVSEKTSSLVGLSGSVVSRATKHLDAYKVGAGSVEYVGEKPEVIDADTWSWRKNKESGERQSAAVGANTFVQPATPAALASAARLHQPREPPQRERMAIHMRVKKAKKPQLQDLEGSSYWAKRLADMVPTAGAVAVGALAVVGIRRRRLARLAKQAS